VISDPGRLSAADALAEVSNEANGRCAPDSAYLRRAAAAALLIFVVDPEVAVRLMLAGFLLGIVHDRAVYAELHHHAGHDLAHSVPWG